MDCWTATANLRPQHSRRYEFFILLIAHGGNSSDSCSYLRVGLRSFIFALSSPPALLHRMADETLNGTGARAGTCAGIEFLIFNFHLKVDRKGNFFASSTTGADKLFSSLRFL
jgi:hypothetical protein